MDNFKEKYKSLIQKINEFTDEQVKAGHGWPPVTSKDLSDLREIFNAIIDLKFERDVDGDSVINFVLADRNTERISNNPLIPHSNTINKLNFLASSINESSNEINHILKFPGELLKNEVLKKHEDETN